MRRDELVAALRRAKIVAALRALVPGPPLPRGAGPGRGLEAGPARERARAALAALRRRPDALVALALGAGVLAMVLHWG